MKYAIKYSRIKKLFTISTVLFTLILAGCASSKVSDPYYEENIKDFSVFSLKNDIPLVLKKTSGQIVVLRVVFEGGTPLVAQEKAGIEDILLDLMFHGSVEYSYEDIQNMQYNMSFSLNSSAGKDYSVAGVKCIKKDLDTVLALFADSILNPILDEKDFSELMLQKKESLQRTLSDPSGLLSVELHKAVYAGHSYKTSDDVTLESVDSITLDDVKSHYKNLMDSARIKIVVVANFEGEELIQFEQKLDGYFGSIKKGSYSRPKIDKIVVSGENLYIKNEQAGDSAYSIGFFDCPERYDSDYVPFAISLMYLDDIFFEQVREKAGAVYSVGSGVLGGRDMVGAISAYKISDKKNIDSLMLTAIESFPDEKTVAQKLDQYKNKYITTLFGSSQNGAGVAANIITSLEYSGSYDTYLKRSEEVQTVTAKQVVNAYKKYIAQDKKSSGGKINPMRWITVTND